jgi:predicted Zn finger-like uncharacterized protein
MIEIQCTSCHTRYRIDERVLPDDTPTFKCSRCGHVFNADPVPAKHRVPSPAAAEQATEKDSQPAQTLRPPRPRASAPATPAPQRSVMREAVAPARSAEPEFEPPIEHEHHAQQFESVNQHIDRQIPQPATSESNGGHELESDHPLNRTFGDREQKADTGENFRFDFSDERREIGEAARDHQQEHHITAPERGDDQWQVGDAPAEFEAAPARHAPTMTDAHEPPPRPSPASAIRVAAALKAARPRIAEAPQPAKSAGYELGHLGEDADDMPMLGKTYASGYFIAMFFVVAIGFVAASGLISSEPVASARVLSQAPGIGSYFARPIVPAMLVALHDFNSEYRTLKGGQVALVITGSAQNVGARPLHLVQIDADLLGADGAHTVASLGVYCGNELSAKMLGEMTPREIEFSQGLSPQKSFAMQPSGAAPFLMVFINPPEHAGKVRLSVSKAVAADIAEPAARAARRN